MRSLIPLVFAFSVVGAAASAQDINGRITVIDGDTLDLGGVRVRLFGIDAVEVNQTCTDGSGREWACGRWVAAEAARLLDGQSARCLVLDMDRYGRAVARCLVDGSDIAETLVTLGLAQAYRRYSMDYDLAEKVAQLAGAGLWSSTTMAPADFRAADATGTDGAVPPDLSCPIKGNISSSGHIYHMPGQADYNRTRIDPARGERWFCSEGEAQAAGWRPALR